MAWEKAHPAVPKGGEAAVRSVGGESVFQINVKLPKLDLPRFSDEVIKFNPFWQQFVTGVDDQDIPAISKFNYLIWLLRQDAKSLLEDLPITEENWPRNC